ncbi:hypothetical protein M427DRAFT_121684 [Gonapodya prolifera JEL478]|uniref:SEC7 domain-containing protein n=1 Tax=Gonapodya prolifera (strain JEL478) TaxID=1344416 RepID=A0A139AMN1_GONPJ|nr:hypothetical protein M427DRAFT_121684 [Gonapodya prolifera JEL478]|eukprot:KXS18026.1 hypothetical protein M427DRAFT_121684 [Gonapodya prolifera JEL478]
MSATIAGSILTSLPRKASLPSVNSPVSAPYDVFIRNALETLVKESRKNTPLKEAAKKALASLGPAPPHPSSSKESLGSAEHQNHSPATLETIFGAFQLACQSRSSALASVAIDCLGKLFTYNYWGSDADPVLAQLENGLRISEDTDLEDNAGKRAPTVGSKSPDDRPRTYVDKVIDLICDSPLQEGSDEKLQLQIIKALSAACSTNHPSSALHTSTLLRAIRTAYNIFLLARDANTQIVAQATLTQIIVGVFARVNRNPKIDVIPEEPPQSISNNNSVPSSAQASREDITSKTMLREGRSEDGKVADSARTPSSKDEDNSNDTNTEVDSISKEAHPIDSDPLVVKTANVTGPVDEDSEPAEVVSTLAAPALSLNGEALSSGSVAGDGTPTSADQATLSAGSLGSADTQSVISNATKAGPEERTSLAFDSRPPSPVPSHVVSVPKDSVRGTYSLDSFRTNVTEDDFRRRASPEPKRALKRAETYDDLLVKDAFLVFRALCKLSMKGLPGSDGPAIDLKSQAMRSKLLALHLLNSILTSQMTVFLVPSPVLFSSPQLHPKHLQFIQAVKQYLCLSLTRNAASPIPQVFDISLEIFAKLVVGLRQQLKAELSVLFTELILPILESRQSVTFHQRLSLLRALLRIFSDPQEGSAVLVEIYLNYDCDPEASGRENVWERMVNALSKVVSWTAIEALQQQQQQSDKTPTSSVMSVATLGMKGGFAPAITTATLSTLTKDQTRELLSTGGDYTELRKRTLEVLVRGILVALVNWCTSRGGFTLADNRDRKERERDRTSLDQDKRITSAGSKEVDDEAGGGGLGLTSNAASPTVVADDPTQFENLKHRKQVLQEGIRKFNFKPKKGMQFLLDSKCISSRTPRDIGRFLLLTDGLDKKMIGEFLGEGDEENISIMHAFVDEMEFSNMKFVDALRHFLQAFRLPGEAQKIDRFMLKFAERFLKGNPTQFSNADTAYVLAYSVIMLNTDLHNPQIKKHMTKEEFIKNNRGINDGKDLPREFLESTYDEISTNEIRMKEEMEKAGKGTGKVGDTDGSRDDESRKGRSLASEAIAMKTEAAFTKMLKARKRVTQNQMVSSEVGASASVSSTWFSATHYEHVRSMFDLVWTPLLAGVSGPLQDTEDAETISLSLEGLKYAIRIACLFNMDLERRAFVSTLSKLTMLPTVSEMRPKNLEAIKQLLEAAWLEGNNLVESWKDVCLCISQLEKLSLLGGGGPDEAFRKASVVDKSRSPAKQSFADEVASESTSQVLVVAVDRIFTSSVKLSGSAITDFANALCQVSWEEIQSSSQWEHPRMFSLQKLVEVSYYNMGRIRVEWSNLWHILGEHFNKVGGHQNRNVALFAVDRLRQLALKFLDIEELPHFKFQKDFLRPFEVILQDNTDVNIKDLVLRSLTQMIQMKSKNMRSGWKAMLLVFTKAAKEQIESVVTLAFETVKNIQKTYLELVVGNNAFPDLVNCIVEFCKNRNYAKTSLQAIELLRATIHKMVEIAKSPIYVKAQSGGSVLELSTPTNITLSRDPNSEKPTATVLNPLSDDPMFKFWFPMLFGLYEVIMTCDLEVRTRALTYLFDALKSYGSTFTRDFWDVVCRGVLLPIFDDLRLSRSEKTKFANKEDMSVWLSTTLIKALREFVDLFSFYFEVLNFLVDGVLDLLAVCITQENETLARIGSTCLQQFIESNVHKMDDDGWTKVCHCFVNLFEATTPYGLFEYPGGRPGAVGNAEESRSAPVVGGGAGDGNNDQDEVEFQPNGETDGSSDDEPPQKPTELRVQTDAAKSEGSAGMAQLNAVSPPSPKDRKKDFQQTVMKCVLQLLLIQTLHETINQNENIYRSLKSKHMFVLLDCLDRSYLFARKFNNDTDLRMALYRGGFMQQLPNLLKQETTSVTSYISALIRMYSDGSDERRSVAHEVEQRLIPLSRDILILYNGLDPETKKRNILAWRPVVVMILNSLVNFREDDFRQNISQFYSHCVDLLMHDIPPELRLGLHSVFTRIGTTYSI